MASSVSLRELVACRECDLVQALPREARGRTLTCARCGGHLHARRGDALERVLPLTLGAAVLFLLANTSPIVALEAAGTRSSASLLGAVTALTDQGILGVAVIVALTTFVAPAAELALLAYALCALTLRRRLWGLAGTLRALQALRPWTMVEVFMLGVLVSLVKLAGLARVIPGVGLWSLCGVILLTAAAHTAFDTRSYWERLEELT